MGEWSEGAKGRLREGVVEQEQESTGAREQESEQASTRRCEMEWRCLGATRRGGE
jgi:hypothetical protein